MLHARTCSVQCAWMAPQPNDQGLPAHTCGGCAGLSMCCQVLMPVPMPVPLWQGAALMCATKASASASSSVAHPSRCGPPAQARRSLAQCSINTCTAVLLLPRPPPPTRLGLDEKGGLAVNMGPGSWWCGWGRAWGARNTRDRRMSRPTPPPPKHMRTHPQQLPPLTPPPPRGRRAARAAAALRLCCRRRQACRCPAPPRRSRRPQR